jgi:predicted hydrolase (HD superfamily)
MISRHRKTLLVLVAEGVLERALVRDLRDRGAQWWTIGEVHGATREGVREGAWEADRTIELKVLCDPGVADSIAEHVLATYAQNYAVAFYFSEVWVARPDRY